MIFFVRPSVLFCRRSRSNNPEIRLHDFRCFGAKSAQNSGISFVVQSLTQCAFISPSFQQTIEKNGVAYSNNRRNRVGPYVPSIFNDTRSPFAHRAGVIGLSVALKLQDLIRSRDAASPTEILLIAREWPTSIPGTPTWHSPDYASMWAGAHVRPIPASTPQLRREARWLKETVGEFARLVDSRDLSGITMCPAIEFLDEPPAPYVDMTAETFAAETGLPGYRRMGASEVPEGVRLGFEYQTYCVNSPLYCSDLLRKFVLRGGKTLNRDLRSEWEAFSLREKVLFVVNASGAGFGDLKSFPTRGEISRRIMYRTGLTSTAP